MHFYKFKLMIIMHCVRGQIYISLLLWIRLCSTVGLKLTICQFAEVFLAQSMSLFWYGLIRI